MTAISAGPRCTLCAQAYIVAGMMHKAGVRDCFQVQSTHVRCVREMLCQKSAYLGLETFICNPAQGATAGWLQARIDLSQIILQLLVIWSSGQCLYIQTVLIKLWLTDWMAQSRAVSICEQRFILASGQA